MIDKNGPIKLSNYPVKGIKTRNHTQQWSSLKKTNLHYKHTLYNERLWFLEKKKKHNMTMELCSILGECIQQWYEKVW